MEILKAVFNKGLARALVVVFAVALVLIPFTSISDERVYVPDKSSFAKQTAKGSNYIAATPGTTSASSGDTEALDTPDSVTTPSEIAPTGTADGSGPAGAANTAGATVASDPTAETGASPAPDAAVTADPSKKSKSTDSKSKPKSDSKSKTNPKTKPDPKPGSTDSADSKNSKNPANSSDSKDTKDSTDSTDSKTPKNLVKKPSSNRDKIWNYLLENGYTEKQTAGIMGNLQQENEFSTSGDGIAQWNGDRRAKLRKMKNPQSLETQLEFLVQVELKGSCSDINKAIKASKTIDEATRIFCDRFERPGIPLMSKRLAYAHKIYDKYHK